MSKPRRMTESEYKSLIRLLALYERDLDQEVADTDDERATEDRRKAAKVIRNDVCEASGFAPLFVQHLEGNAMRKARAPHLR